MEWDRLPVSQALYLFLEIGMERKKEGLYWDYGVDAKM